MELQRNAEFLRALGHIDFRASIPLLQEPYVSVEMPQDPYYIIFPGAGWVNRQWPVERFAKIATLLYAATGWKGLVCGSKGDMGLGRRLLELSDAQLEDWTNRTTLPELAALIAGSRLLIGNETSAVHLAAAVSTRALCVLGGGHFGRFVPYNFEQESDSFVPLPVYSEMSCYGCNWVCIYLIEGEQPVPCIANITVEAVWDALQPIIRS
jgi:ADP-heptose:LPS heptosyltransferase